jgi:hypothetical protein
MVPRAGFEPATLGLEVLCSIQLSYRGLLRIITDESMVKSNEHEENI